MLRMGGTLVVHAVSQDGTGMQSVELTVSDYVNDGADMAQYDTVGPMRDNARHGCLAERHHARYSATSPDSCRLFTVAS